MRRAIQWSLAVWLVSAAASADPLPMWEVEGQSNRVTLLGSIHFLRQGQDALPAQFVQAYREADVVIMEIDMDDLDPVAAATTMQQLGIDAQGRTLEALLGARDYGKAVEKARAIGVDLSLMRGLEPWLAALTITQLQLAQLGFAADAGVEQQLLQLAQRDDKEIRGLETLDEQLGALDGLSPAAQRDFLLQTLDDAAVMKEKVGDIVSAWKSGDAKAMEEQLLEDLEEQPEVYRKLVVDRNRNWARQLGPLLKERKDYLIVVGTLHLVGPDSLVGMLEKAGHEPRQVSAD